MSLSVNVVILAGNLTRNPDLRYTPQGVAVCDFGVAVNEVWNDKVTGEKREEVHFIECTVWREAAERAAEGLKKGSGVWVEGKLRQERWETPEGKKQSKTKVTVNRWQYTTAKRDEPLVAPDTGPVTEEDIPF